MRMSELILYVFFFEQKTAYGVRMSGWRSDVCSSDLICSMNSTPTSVQNGGPKRWMMAASTPAAAKACWLVRRLVTRGGACSSVTYSPGGGSKHMTASGTHSLSAHSRVRAVSDRW